tara:strand:+ start:2410 stop:3339 length:930 start_codon:yes stop_codon:yes gene_type:complete
MRDLILKILNSIPESFLDKLLFIWRRSFFRKFKKSRELKLANKRKLKHIQHDGKISSQELLIELRRFGINKGDILFVQTSFNDLLTLEANPYELINTLKKLVGSQGTLLTPAYTIPKLEKNWIFDPKLEPTYTGIVNEVFRRTPQAIRSLHPRHSVCGYGPLAKEILVGHEQCDYADGKGSPLDKIRLIPHSKILTLGLPRGFVSHHHWLEDFEPEKLPFPVHKESSDCYKVRKGDDSIVNVSDYNIKKGIALFGYDYEAIATNLSTNALTTFLLKGITICVYNMLPLSEELKALRDDGLLQYKISRYK